MPSTREKNAAYKTMKLEYSRGRSWNLPETDTLFTRGRNAINLRKKLEYSRGRNWNLPETDKPSTGERNAINQKRNLEYSKGRDWNLPGKEIGIFERMTSSLREQDKESTTGRN